MTVRVLIVDDQSIIRSGLRAVLGAYDDVEVAAEAADGAEAVGLARELRPDVILMDLVMPKIGGIEATVQIMRPDDPPRILVLTSFQTDDLVLDALEAGASGFLLKDARPEELIAAVRAVAAGGSAMSPEIMGRLVERAGSRAPAVSDDVREKLDTLTGSEREVLRLIGSGLTNQQIATELHLSPASVKTYVSRMLARLGLDNRTQAAILAYETGLLGDGSAEA
ncbi:response regulator transcription factor [Streptomyces sp. NBC_01465]|uniref:response regulator transcription factor n=1 Tax=Streptomyces sp. NBC_01465 TaxID=2903878 RepID=UPI002E30794E|nr:response regulator transcription factor [Streptomyces sp. NBC_01465]